MRNRIQELQTNLSPRQRIFILLMVIILVVVLLLATVFRDSAASSLRILSQSKTEDFPHNAQSSSLFLGLRSNLLISTQSQIQVYSPTGSARLKEQVSMSSPAVNASNSYAVVYDVGGQQLRVVKDGNIVHQLDLPTEESLLCATVNSKGWVAVTSKTSGYKAVVTVYDSSFDAVIAIRLSSRYISDAVVTPDCRGVYLISPGQLEGAFENTLLYYTFSNRDYATREVSLGSNVVLSILSSNKCWILGDNSLLILDSSGVITGEYSYDSRYLKMGTLQGSGFATLFLSRSASGSSGTLVTVDDDGDEIGRLSIQGQALALAAQGQNIALLTTGDVYTTSRKLGAYRAQPNQLGIRNLAIYEDGGVALIGSASVSLYYPAGASIDNDGGDES